ncbi:MAG: MerR family transcriptional regulator [Gammaproteobacteria bacterium]|nr:MerR family transcriptional regulator [Gammaproteobacteria bacterium]
MPTARDPERASHPIQVVARRTGLSTYVLRAWEHRYNAVAPARSASGRRLYSDADVERLTLLQSATRAGRRIGEVASLAREDLVEMCLADSFFRASAPAIPIVDSAPPEVDQHLRTCLEAIRQMNPFALEAALYNASVAVSVQALLENVMCPLLHAIGHECRHGDMRISEEHMASAIIRSFLGTLKLNGRVPRHSELTVVVTTPAGQRHELGALMAAVTAANEGWNAIYLGADLPADEIAAAAFRTGARAVAVSITYPDSDPQLVSELRRLRRQIGFAVVLLVGGGGASTYRRLFEEIGALRLENLIALRDALGKLSAST